MNRFYGSFREAGVEGGVCTHIPWHGKALHLLIPCVHPAWQTWPGGGGEKCWTAPSVGERMWNRSQGARPGKTPWKWTSHRPILSPPVLGGPRVHREGRAGCSELENSNVLECIQSFGLFPDLTQKTWHAGIFKDVLLLCDVLATLLFH